MYTLSVAVIVAFVAVCNAGLIGPAALLQSPSASATVIGSDGSAILSASPGIVSAVSPGLVASPLAATIGGPLIAPGLIGTPNTIISGPSGTVVSGRSILGHGLLGAHGGLILG